MERAALLFGAGGVDQTALPPPGFDFKDVAVTMRAEKGQT
jgi:hypothetical protein